MCLSPSLVYTIGLLGFLHSAKGAETDPNALPPGAVARLGASHLRIGYGSFTLTPDGRTIVTVSPQGIVRRFDAQSGRLLERRQLTDRGDVDPTAGSNAHLSADGRIAAMEESSYTRPRVTVWDVSSGKRLFRRTSTESRHTGLGRLSPDGKQLAVDEFENNGSRLRVFDLKTGRRSEIVGNGLRNAVAGQDVFGLKTGRISEIGAFQFGPPSVLFSADGKRLLVARLFPQAFLGSTFPLVNSHTITYFDLPSGKELWQRTVLGENFAISRDGRMVLATGFRDQTFMDPGFHVLQMDAKSGKLTKRFVPCQLDGIPSVGNINFALAPDDRTIVINLLDQIVLWDLHTRKEIRRFKMPKTNDVWYTPSRMVVSADGRTLLTNAEYLQRWNLTTGKPFFEPPPDNGLFGSFFQLAFTPEGKEMFASSYGRLSGRWNVATGRRIDLIIDNYDGSQLTRTPGGLRAIRYEFRERQYEFTVLDPIAQKALHVIRWTATSRGAAPNVKAYSLTANGKTLLTIHSDQHASHLTAWDVRSGHQVSRFSIPGTPSFSRSPFSPCGRWVFLNDKLYHVASGTELFAPTGTPDERLVLGHQRAYGPAWFSEDGRLMAGHLRNNKEKSAAEDTLAVWELASGEILARFPKAGFVVQVSFAADGRTIALLDARGVRLEDLLSGKRRAMYPAPDVICGTSGNGCEMQGLVFTPDGRTLATGHHDGTILLWKVPQIRATEPIVLSGDEKEKLWVDLASESPGKGRAAVERLVRCPEAASLLASRFRPPPHDAKLDKFIKDLDSDVFATREEASRKLREYGARAEPILRRVLAGAPSLEMRRRIEGILAVLTAPVLRLPLSGDRLRGVRTIEVLERIATAEARKLLRAWTEQTGDVSLAIEARRALERINPANTRIVKPSSD